MADYWTRSGALVGKRSRRSVLKGAGLAAVGAAGAALLGCGDDDDDGNPDETATSVQTRQPDASSTPQALSGGQIKPSAADEAVLEQFPFDYPEPGTPKRGGQLRVVGPQDLSGLDPTASASASTVQHVNIAYNRLLGFKTGPGWGHDKFPGEIVPDLAASHELPDNTTITFKIDPRAKWQDEAPLNGRKFTAQDAAFALESYRAKGAATHHMRMVDKIQAPSDDTLTITLKEPFADQLTYFASRFLPIFPRELAESGELATKAVGTGPMILREARKGERMVWERNPSYFAGDIWLDGVLMQFVPSGPTRQQMLRSGQVDLTLTTFSNMEDVRSLVDSTADAQGTKAYPISGRINLALQLRSAPWNDVRMRRAIGMGTDTQKWGDLSLGSNMHYTGPNIPWPLVLEAEPTYESLGQWYQYNPSEAKKLISAAGGEGTEVELIWYTYQSQYDDFGDLFAEDLRALGLVPKLNKMDNTSFNAQWTPGKFTSAAFGWKALPVAADDVFTGYHSKSATNRWGINDSEVDALVEKQSKSLDAEERRQIWKEIWDRDLDQMWYKDLPDSIQFNVMGPKVRNLRFGWIQTNVTDAYDYGQQLPKIWLD